MNILLTGATGFVGSHLLYHLLNEKHQVTILKRRTSDIWRIKDSINNVSSVDIENENDLSEVISQHHIDAVIHTATLYIKRETDQEELQAMNEANITFPTLLLDAAVKTGVKYVINTGTCFEYALSDKPVSETSPIEAYNYYAATKIAFEHILSYYAKMHKIHAATLKLFYPYGEKDNKKIIPLVLQSYVHDRELIISKGEQELDFTYVGDIVKAYSRTLSYLASESYNGYTTYNIGAGKATQIKDLVSHIEQISGKKGIVHCSKPYPPHDIMHLEADPSKAQNVLGWRATTSIEEGLKKTYNYYLHNER
jgi:nucleoside-diphosphate-sugar epimerase